MSSELESAEEADESVCSVLKPSGSKENVLKKRVSEVNLNLKMKYNSHPHQREGYSVFSGVLCQLVGYLCQMLNIGAAEGMSFEGPHTNGSQRPHKLFEFQMLTNYKVSEVDLTRGNGPRRSRLVFEPINEGLERELAQMEQLKQKVRSLFLISFSYFSVCFIDSNLFPFEF